MTNEMKTFDFNGRNVRTIIVNGEPYWVAKDVAEILGYSVEKGMGQVINHVPNEWKGSTPNLNGGAEMLTLSEQGLYFFLARSDKPLALPFQKWIAGEVLPSIRKHGGYSATPKLTPEQKLAEACLIAQQMLAERNTEILALSKKLQEAEPKATYYDKVLKSKEPICLTILAKDYGLSATALNRLLNDWHIQYKVDETWVLYSKYHNYRYTLSETYIDDNDRPHILTKWTQAGRFFIYEQMKKRGYLPLIEKETPPTDRSLILSPEAGGRITVADMNGNDVEID
ncbi:MAG: phage antirepressor KilAC domain-containing protein [Planctomycetaceae bacterium]|jgi:prophage antirepressor-like protein|nr:phage antirepressor KilAC domain-containing protein [Planctomycetaceae bacterium]